MILEQFRNQDVLLVTPNSMKMKLLEKNQGIHRVKYMTLEEYKSHYFFSWDYNTLDYLMSTYQYHLDFCKIILNNLYVIDLNHDYQNKKLKFLKKIKQELIKKNLLIYDLFFAEFLKNKTVVVYGYDVLDQYEEEMFSNATIIKKEIGKLSPIVMGCDSLEDEVVFICEEILKLYQKGIPLSKIFLANITSSDLYTIYQIFSYYSIPISLDMKQSLYGTNMVKEYLKTKKLPGFTNQIVQKLLDTVNALVSLETSKNYRVFLVDALKNTYLPKIKYQESVSVLDDLEIMEDDCYLFILGFQQDALPKIYKDEDYISDSIKSEVLLDTTQEKNKKERESFHRVISNTKNCFLSYHEKTNFDEFLPSSMIDELSLEVRHYQRGITHSNFYNQLLLGQDLDTYYKYHEISDQLIPFASHYHIPYSTYDHQFTGIKKTDLFRYLNEKLKVSYTSLNSYNLCAFQYYIRYVLRIDPFLENFSATVGNLFHYMFSIMDLDNFNFEREWNHYIEKLDVSVAESVLLEELKHSLLDDIRIIKDQDHFTTYSDKLYEQEIGVVLDKEISTVLTGKIDKIMYQKSSTSTFVSVIDYKTGSISIDLPLIKYGLQMQLPIYLYLIEKSHLFKQPLYSGMYLQKVLYPRFHFESSKNWNQLMENGLKLQGYSTDCLERLSSFDKTYEASEFIKGMKINKNGSFSSHSKIFSDDLFSNLIHFTEQKINSTTDQILTGDFSIHPKVVDQKNLACTYCKYKDLCFRTNQDFVYLEKVDDFSFLGGDHDDD